MKTLAGLLTEKNILGTPLYSRYDNVNVTPKNRV
jgi:hypothetical protein